MNFVEYGIAGLLIVVVLFATYGYLGFASRARVENNFETPDDILTAVKVYESYNRHSAAVKLLEKGLKKNPHHPQLEQKLAELNRGTQPNA